MIGRIYRWVPEGAIRLLSRPLPERIGVYNGVAVRDVPFFRQHDYQPYKKGLLWNATRSMAEPGDTITFVGGGKGIVPIKAATRGYDVRVIEGAKHLADQLEETAGLNGVDIDVVHGVVGDPANVWGDFKDAKIIEPENLRGSLAVLDCEGAEATILPLGGMKTVVETHPMHGVSETRVRELLSGNVVSFGRNEHGGKVFGTYE